jgi:hypothetical protein
MRVMESRHLGGTVHRSPSGSASQPITESLNKSTLAHTWPFDSEFLTTTKLKNHPLSAVRGCWFNISATAFEIWRRKLDVRWEKTAGQHVTDRGQRRRLQDRAYCDDQCNVITLHITSWFPARAEQTGSAASPSVPPACFMPPPLCT